ncbi:MAG: tRNA glutamyl-Q(34) synthetase GluQRS [Gemmobacter sp.]|nr:tRNA glutamyl-Q(34) synthetase GluQRS [Gemmobacter sp.]
MTYVTRFAPSPTGPLHLGHAYSALTAHDRARAMGGTFLLRIEDIDPQRCKPEWEAQIISDLRWLGLTWAPVVLRQSERLTAYRAALDRLTDLGVLYPCRCTRGDIRAALSAPQEGVPLTGPDGLIYPGTCHHRPMTDAGPQDAIRLDMARALALIGPPTWTEGCQPPTGIRHAKSPVTTIGDVVLARRDFGTSYHLSVVVDDAAQSVTEIVRGEDLAEATPIHVILQALLQVPTPNYWHHILIRDKNGKRLAKRDDARALALFRAEGATPADIRRLVGLSDTPIGTWP